MTGRADPFDDAPATVLVIDDNPVGRYVIASWLGRAGHTVLEAADGAEGLAYLAPGVTPLPELAVVDVRLPDMSGFEVCERIKSDPRTAGTPVIHVSATALATADRTQGLHRGADAYLTEPIAPSELVATVTAALRYSRARTRAERLAARLSTLNQATLDVYAAAGGEAFADAAAAGARTLMQYTAVLIAETPGGDSVLRTSAEADRDPVSESATPEALRALSDIALGDRVGVEVSAMSGEEWVGYRVGGPLTGDVVVAVARTKRSRPVLCIALSSDAVRDPEDGRLLSQFAQACALALEALRSYTREHALAVTLQRALLPERLPTAPGTELAVRYLPANAQSEIGGDFYEAVETPDGLILAAGDVAGHSLQAAMVMGELRYALRVYALEGHGPRVLLEHLDRLLCLERPGWTATLCLVRIAPDGKQIEIANAGHVPPLVRAPDGTAVFVPGHGPLLGMDSSRPAPVTHDIAAGSMILLVTDGLVEVRGTDLADSLEELRLAVQNGPADPQAVCEHVLDRFGRVHDDDVVVLSALVGRTRGD